MIPDKKFGSGIIQQKEILMKRILIFIFSTVITLSSIRSFAEQNQQDMVSVRIASTNFGMGSFPVNLNQVTIYPNAYAHFYVVMTNVSNKPLRLWSESYSWGYSNLSFQVTDKNGKITIIKREKLEWDKNVTSWIFLQPGDLRVLEVTLDPKIWQNVDALLPEKFEPKKVKIKAIFEIPEDRDAKECNVWTGKVYSPEQTYTIYR